MLCRRSKIGKIIVCALHSNQFSTPEEKHCLAHIRAGATRGSSRRKSEILKKKKITTLIWMLLLLVTVAALRNVVVFCSTDASRRCSVAF